MTTPLPALTLNHHPGEELLLDYAAGSLPEPVALVIASHVALCSACSREYQRLTVYGSELFDEVQPVDVDEDALAAVLERLDEPVQDPAPLPAMDAETMALLPAPLRRYVGRSLKALPWKRFGQMFDEARLPIGGKQMKTSLMRLTPGALMPQHTHRGNEYTLVLAGGFSDGPNQYLRGDFVAKDVSDRHQPRVDADGECVCLVVLDAPLKLTSPLGRLVNPFLRI